METLTWALIVAALASGAAVVPVLEFLKWLERKLRHLAEGTQGLLELYAIPAALALSIIVPILGRYLAGIPEPDPLLVKGVLVLITWALAALGYDVVRGLIGRGGGLGTSRGKIRW